MHHSVEHSPFCYYTAVMTSSWTGFQHDSSRKEGSRITRMHPPLQVPSLTHQHSPRVSVGKEGLYQVLLLLFLITEPPRLRCF